MSHVHLRTCRMLHIVRRKILHQRSATVDINRLQAVADPKQGQLPLLRDLQQLPVQPLPRWVGMLRLGSPICPIDRRIDVSGTPGKHDPICLTEEFAQAGRFHGGVDHPRHSTRLLKSSSIRRPVPAVVLPVIPRWQGNQDTRKTCGSCDGDGGLLLHAGPTWPFAINVCSISPRRAAVSRSASRVVRPAVLTGSPTISRSGRGAR